ncbi:hypothetical protein ACFW2V_35295 [Streptomyces sp. NPDC058947]|uniref:hypothetical protein n=1 Tax=Streptomyces sp. NPDC058947 TaxID=3346675 RepID=UPI0036AB8CAE
MTQQPDAGVTTARPQDHTSRLSGLACGVSLILAASAALTLVFALLTRSAQRPHWHPWFLVVSEPVLILAFAAPGAVVAIRRSRNPVGWLLLATGCGMAVDNLARAYGLYASHHGLPGTYLAVWMSTWTSVLVSYPIFFLLLLFPDGRLPSAKWRIVAWYTGACAVISFLGSALMPGPPNDGYFPLIDNPLGVSGLSFLRDITGLMAIPFALVPFLLSAASLIYRFRTSRRLVREQLKWVALSLYAAVFLIGTTITLPFASIATALATVLFSTGVMIAITRHRLFDIDRLLSRSLLYTTLHCERDRSVCRNGGHPRPLHPGIRARDGVASGHGIGRRSPPAAAPQPATPHQPSHLRAEGRPLRGTRRPRKADGGERRP